MISSTPTLFAGLAILAGTAQAFLLPTVVAPADNDIIKSIPFENVAQVHEQTLNLKCVGCPVATTDNSGNSVWLQGVDSELQLIFSIINVDIDKLSLNGLQLYPPHDLSAKPLTASQITADGQKDLRLGYELGVKPIARTENEQIEVISIDFQVVELADKFVSGLDNVELKLLKLPSGKLMMGSLVLRPTKNPIINPSDSGEECTTLICKWRAIVSDRLSQSKSAPGCGSKSPSKHSGHRTNGHHRHHRHHDKHLRIIRFFMAFKTVAIHVLVPVFIGVAVGMTASLVGMLVGNFVIFLWRTLYRRGHRGSYSRLNQAGNNLLDTQYKPTNVDNAVDVAEAPVYEAIVDEKSNL